MCFCDSLYLDIFVKSAFSIWVLPNYLLTPSPPSCHTTTMVLLFYHSEIWNSQIELRRAQTILTKNGHFVVAKSGASCTEEWGGGWRGFVPLHDFLMGRHSSATFVFMAYLSAVSMLCLPVLSSHSIFSCFFNLYARGTHLYFAKLDELSWKAYLSLRFVILRANQPIHGAYKSRGKSQNTL